MADLAGLAEPDEIIGFFTLTLVRNPWDRAASYYHWLRDQRFAHPAVGLARARDFSGFLNHPQTQASLAAWPYGAWMRDRSGVERCRLFLRLERFADEVAPFEAHLGFGLAPLARANASARPRDWRPLYSDDDAALLARLCAEDVTRFGYDFNGLA
jgi:hypothetical protein